MAGKPHHQQPQQANRTLADLLGVHASKHHAYSQAAKCLHVAAALTKWGSLPCSPLQAKQGGCL